MSFAEKFTAAPLRFKILGYVVAWALALIATDPTFGLWSLAWMFPLGLPRLIAPRIVSDGGWTLLCACFGIYLLHAFFFFRARNLSSTLLWFALLIVLLIINVAGCRDMIHGH
jgi:hypothetical protein